MYSKKLLGSLNVTGNWMDLHHARWWDSGIYHSASQGKTEVVSVIHNVQQAIDFFWLNGADKKGWGGQLALIRLFGESLKFVSSLTCRIKQLGEEWDSSVRPRFELPPHWDSQAPLRWLCIRSIVTNKIPIDHIPPLLFRPFASIMSLYAS